MTRDEVIAALQAEDTGGAVHRTRLATLGLPLARVDAMARDWRAGLALDERLRLAGELWQDPLFEARVAAAKLLTQARIRPDDTAVWEMIRGWAEGFDDAALADHAATAGQKRVLARPARIAEIAAWVTHANILTRRSALAMTLPWARLNNLNPEDVALREEVLGWAAVLVAERDGLIQHAVAGWLRDLSRHDAGRAQAFLAEHGAKLTPAARREAEAHLSV